MISPVSVQENVNGTLQDLVSISDIVDFGSNTNGSWVRFTNGLQLCWFISDEIGTSSGLFSRTCTFPALFVTNPAVWGFNDINLPPTTTSTTQIMLWGVITSTINTRSCRISCRAFDVVVSTRQGRFLAIGFWK